ncbi:unnamed protein product [Prunus armeniaca]|uniref:Uncharacterized protein n=1 Tax=Prunus armeniaca TaxID=36596 RepID=A0A6J5WHJ3_PRUAR|nr:hypothetical protein GBA52_006894 [Prunus armeniaca]CAB4301186.1 unnamed protein product [Prunus armeniaca]
MDSMQNETDDSDHDHQFSIKPNSAQPNTACIPISDPDLNQNFKLHACIKHPIAQNSNMHDHKRGRKLNN